MLNPILAHGALGPFDEIIFIAVAVVFLGMMALSWMRSRDLPPLPDDEDELKPEAAPDSPDRFRLD